MPKPSVSPTEDKKRIKTDIECRSATCQPDKKRERFYDAMCSGLYLEVTHRRKGWFHKFRLPIGVDEETGKVSYKETRMSIGGFPAVSLAEARAKVKSNRRLLEEGKNPITERQQTKLQVVDKVTLTEVAEDFIAKNQHKWSASYKTKVLRHWNKYLKPRLGRKFIDDITKMELKATVEAIIDGSIKGRRQTARETLRMAAQVWDWAPVDLPRGNIARQLINAKLLPAPEVTHYAAAVTEEDLRPVMRAIRASRGRSSPWVSTALQLVPLLFLRQINIRQMRWEQIDWKAATLTIPRQQMKTKKRDGAFVTPLPRQALALLEDLRPLTGHWPWCFPSRNNPKDAPISEAALPEALSRCGIPSEQQMIHGFRRSAETLLLGQGFKKAEIEAQLDHAKEGLGDTYDAATYLPQRRKMLQAWADYLDALSGGVEPSKARKSAH